MDALSLYAKRGEELSCMPVTQSFDPGVVLRSVAGSGTRGWAGDGQAAIGAMLFQPSDVAIDPGTGTLYIADRQNHRVRAVSGSGTITTFAGTGTAGFSGDGGTAAEAQLGAPAAVAVDDSGRVFVATNDRVRMIEDGMISTVLGDGYRGFQGDGGNGEGARFDGISGLACDGDGALYIADTGNHRVRKWAGHKLTTVAGKGSKGFSGDGKSATDAELDEPCGVAVDTAGNLYVADSGNHRVRRVGADDNITTVAGSGEPGFGGDGGSADGAKLNGPVGVAIDGTGNLVIADRDGARIRVVDGAGTIRTLAGDGRLVQSGEQGPAALVSVGQPTGIAIGPDGRIYVADPANQHVHVVESPGGIELPSAEDYDFETGPFTIIARITPKERVTTSSGAQRTVPVTGIVAARHPSPDKQRGGWHLAVVERSYGPDSERNPTQPSIVFRMYGEDGAVTELSAPLRNPYVVKSRGGVDATEINISDAVFKEATHTVAAVRRQDGECMLYLNRRLVARAKPTNPANLSNHGQPLSLGVPEGQQRGMIRAVNLWRTGLDEAQVRLASIAVPPLAVRLRSGFYTHTDNNNASERRWRMWDNWGFWWPFQPSDHSQSWFTTVQRFVNRKRSERTPPRPPLQLSYDADTQTVRRTVTLGTSPPVLSYSVPTGDDDSLRTVLPFHCEEQASSLWCWAAVGTSIVRFYDPKSSKTQCDWVKHIRSHIDPPSGMTPAEIRALSCQSPHLDVGGRPIHIVEGNNGLGGAITPHPQVLQLRRSLNSGRPLYARIAWNAGGGHFVVVSGELARTSADMAQGDKIVVNDPWSGVSTMSFDTLVTNYQGRGSVDRLFFTAPADG